MKTRLRLQRIEVKLNRYLPVFLDGILVVGGLVTIIVLFALIKLI